MNPIKLECIIIKMEIGIKTLENIIIFKYN